MGIRKINDIIVLDFTTHNPFTGAVQDTDSLPTCEIFEDDNDSEILTPTVTKRVGKIGNYKILIEATIGNGFEIGKSYNVIISATVNNISAKSRIESFVLDSKRIIDLNDLSQSQILSDSTPFAGANIDESVSSRASQTSVDEIKLDTESIITTLSTMVANIWSYVTRTITSGGITAAEVWGYVTRTLTSSGGATPSEIWSYITRTLTSGTKDAEIDLIKIETDKIPSIKTETDKIKYILGLSQENYRLFDVVYDNGLIISTTIKTYPTSTNCTNNTNPLATYNVIAEYDLDGKLTSYKVIKA